MSTIKIKVGLMELPISSEDLISAVQNRPFLYDSKLEDFNDKRKKLAAWMEICEEVIPNWSKIKHEDNFIEFELQKKWRNLRDCYTRAYKKQMIAKASGSRKPRTYVYYDLLSFLEPLVSKRYSAADKKMNLKGDSDDSNEAEYLNDNSNENDNSVENNKNDFHHVLLDNFPPDEESVAFKPDEIFIENNNKVVRPNRKLSHDKLIPPTQPSKSPTEHKKMKLNENIHNLIETMNNDSTKDPDEMFLLGLLPHLKKIHEHKRLEMQIELMQLLKTRLDRQGYE